MDEILDNDSYLDISNLGKSVDAGNEVDTAVLGLNVPD